MDLAMVGRGDRSLWMSMECGGKGALGNDSQCLARHKAASRVFQTEGAV